jgi:hypothetical protein
MTQLHGYALVAALEEDVKDCARLDRSLLLKRASEEIKSLVEQNKALLSAKQALEKVWAYPGLLRSIQGTTDGQVLVTEIKRIVGG